MSDLEAYEGSFRVREMPPPAENIDNFLLFTSYQYPFSLDPTPPDHEYFITTAFDDKFS